MHSTIIKLKNYKETKNLKNKTLAEALNMIEKFLNNLPTSVQGKTEIVKLTEFEDILSALQNGETLISNDQRIAFENGILVKRNQKGYIVHINPALCLDIPYFVKRKTPLKLEVGKRYKDKEGRVWVIYKENENYFNGIQEHIGEQNDFEEDGVAHGMDSTMDLVEEV